LPHIPHPSFDGGYLEASSLAKGALENVLQSDRCILIAVLNWRAASIIGSVGLAVTILAIVLRKAAKATHPAVAEASDRPLPVPLCIFCDKESGSEEHLWPAWVHRFIREHGINLGGLRIQEGPSPEIIDEDLEKTINTVCHTCNNTWMSRIEDKNRQRFMLMLRNTPFTADPGSMKILTEWAVKTAMVQDSIKPRIGNENFYTREERVAMRERLEIPARTRVWIGALDGFHLGSHGTDFTIKTDGGKVRIGTGCANTIYMGYFVTQVVTEHIYAEYQALGIPEIQPPAGISDSRLIQIYPKVLKKAEWPPAAFTNGGANGIGYLLYRWRQGEKVSMVTKDGVKK
jgi:hypothetical protein